MSKKIFTIGELQPGKKYKFLGETGNYPLNKLVSSDLFELIISSGGGDEDDGGDSGGDVIQNQYYGVASWYLELDSGSSSSVTLSDSYFNHRSDITSNETYYTEYFDIVQEIGWDGYHESIFGPCDSALINGGDIYMHSNLVNDSVKNGEPVVADCDFDLLTKRFSGRSNLLGGIINLDNLDLANTINNHYIIPKNSATSANVNFFDSYPFDNSGYMDLYIGNTSVAVFAKYYTYDYYVKGTYNNTSCIFKCRLRYFGSPNFNQLTPTSIPGSETYYYGTAGSIFSNSNFNKWNSNEFKGSSIGTADVASINGANGSYPLAFYPGSEPYIEDNHGTQYKLINETITRTGDYKWSDGLSYPLYDITSKFINGYARDGYIIGSSSSGGNTGGGTISSTIVKNVNFMNFMKNDTINVYKIKNVGTINAEFTYVGCIYYDMGTLSVGFTQTELDNPTQYGLAFTTGNNITDKNTASIVTLYDDQINDRQNYYVDGEYVFNSYDLVCSIPGFPLFDNTINPYTLMYLTVNDVINHSKTNVNGAEYIGLSYYTHEMYTDIDMQTYNDSDITDAFMFDNGEEICRSATDNYIQTDYGGEYIDRFTVAFANDVELYGYIMNTQSYYKIMSLNANEETSMDSLAIGRGIIPCNGITNDTYLYVNVI